MKISCYSDTGAVRPENEDTVFAYDLETSGKPIYIVGVCDGMGGGVDGKFASSEVAHQVKSAFKELEGFYGDKSIFELVNILKEALTKANWVIYESRSKYGKSQMSGTTSTLTVFKDGKLGYAHIGDTRLYKVSGDVEQVTKDDTWVQSQVDLGLLDIVSAKTHPRRHQITKAVGVSPKLEGISTGVIDYKTGDCFILTSDGYSELLSNSRVFDLISGRVNQENLATKMIEEGQRDNLSSVVIKVEE